jgi:hypothetical protein
LPSWYRTSDEPETDDIVTKILNCLSNFAVEAEEQGKVAEEDEDSEPSSDERNDRRVGDQ